MEEKNKTWLDDNGITNIKIAEVVTEEDINELLEGAVKILRQSQGKRKVLINIIPYLGPFIATPGFRKRMADKVKTVLKDPGFDKVAISGGNIAIRTVTSFIIMASGIMNVRVFNSSEKALSWLRGDKS